MIFKYSCGHEGTEGFWADDKWYTAAYPCPVCNRKKRVVKVTFEKKGKIVLVLKKKASEEDA